MSRFKVYILGCGSALPNLRHNTSAQIVEVHDKMFLVDCGEGTQTQLRKSHVHFSKINAIFISHLHGDHCFGLMGLLSTFGLLGRKAPIQIYAPDNMKELFALQKQMFCSTFEYELLFHPIDTKNNQIIYDDNSLTVETIPLEHRIPCCGFLFREKPGLPHINKEMADYYQVPRSQYNNIKSGAGWLTSDGEKIPNESLVIPAAPPLSYAYCSDTRYMPELHMLVSGVDMLYHESTYGDNEEKQAAKYCHSTARQAATVARDAGVGHLLLGHYSSKYADESLLLREAQEVFPYVSLTDEMDIYDLTRQKGR